MMLHTIAILISSILPWTIGAQNDQMTFPEEFKIGVGSSAYQIEGAWNISDKGPSNWDIFTHSMPHLFLNEGNGDVACDSYHKYKEDIQIVKNIGFDHYRISLSWSRILPTGYDNIISEEGIQYYERVIDEMLEKGIEPFVTIYHWDHPVVFEGLGGWTNELMIDYFVDYARVVFDRLGSRVKFWTTINEPNSLCTVGYGMGFYAPGLKMQGRGPYLCGHNMLKAHARVYHMYDELYRKRQNGTIGITNSCVFFKPTDKNDRMSSQIAYQFNCGWLSHPIFSRNGDYPRIMKEKIRETSEIEGHNKSRLPVFTRYWKKYIRGTSDYFGLNYYTSMSTNIVPKSKKTGWHSDSGVNITYDDNLKTDIASWLKIYPKGIGGLLRKIKSSYNNPDVYILENGLATDENFTDISRINYLHDHMKEVLLAIKRDNCSIKAYTVWTLMDNFEWNAGYLHRFGLIHVNFTDPNLTRTPKISADWIKEVLRHRKLIEFNPHNSD